MRVPRLPVDAGVVRGARVALTSEQAHHLLRVLRLPDGAEIHLFDGAPGDWVGKLRVEGKRRAAVEVEAFVARATESALSVELVQGVCRGQRMDYALEKSVELGVASIQPVVMTRSQAAPEGERVPRKMGHWGGVIAAAAAQSGRTCLPALAPLTGFRDWLAARDCRQHPHILLDPQADGGARDLALPNSAATSITLLAGPEGGFAPTERSAAYEAGCVGLRLGPRVLRTETAALVALAVLQGLYGDL